MKHLTRIFTLLTFGPPFIHFAFPESIDRSIHPIQRNPTTQQKEMGDYHFVYKDMEGSSMQWDDIQRKLRNLPPKQAPFKLPAFTPPSPTPTPTPTHMYWAHLNIVNDHIYSKNRDLIIDTHQ